MVEWLSRLARSHPYTSSSLMTAVVTAIGLAVGPTPVTSPNFAALYLLVVFSSALIWGRRPALFCGVLCSVCLDFFFVRPRYSIAVTDTAYLITLAVFLIVAVVTSELASRSRMVIHEQWARAQAEAAQSRAEAAQARAEAAQARAESARLEMEATNRAKDEVLGHVAHELRSPLGAILGRLQLLRRAAAEPKRTADGLSALERSAQLLSRLIEDLLDASRAHVGKLQVRLVPTSVETPVRTAVERASVAARTKGIGLHAAIDHVCDIRGDGQRIEQIATNLLSNAIKFTDPGGEVQVRVRQVNDEVQLLISDNGDGIAPEFLPHLFEPFSQAATSKAREGLGLGLSIVKHLVEAHGGHIAATSLGAGHGTTFTVGFPLDPLSRSQDSVIS